MMTVCTYKSKPEMFRFRSFGSILLASIFIVSKALSLPSCP